MKQHTIINPEELRELKEIATNGMQTMENVAAVWSVSRRLHPDLSPWDGRITVDFEGRSAFVRRLDDHGKAVTMARLKYSDAKLKCPVRIEKG